MFNRLFARPARLVTTTKVNIIWKNPQYSGTKQSPPSKAKKQQHSRKTNGTSLGVQLKKKPQKREKNTNEFQKIWKSLCKKIPAKLNNHTAHNSHRTIHNNKKQHSAKLTDTTART
jgi:hypothetical protein